MIEKSAAGLTMGKLLEDAQAEQRENIKRAWHNSRCLDVEKMRPYDNSAMVALINGTRELVAMVRD